MTASLRSLEALKGNPLFAHVTLTRSAAQPDRGAGDRRGHWRSEGGTLSQRDVAVDGVFGTHRVCGVDHVAGFSMSLTGVRVT